MSRALRIALTAFAACIFQTNIVEYMKIAGVAPDLMIVFLVLLTGYTGSFGGFCAGSVMAMLYDSSVGYALAINLVLYTFIGWAAPLIRHGLDEKLKKMEHKSYLELMLLCFFLTMVRESVYVGYLFLIGSQQSMVTLMRMLLCAGYSTLMILPGALVLRFIMTFHLGKKEPKEDLVEDEPHPNR